MMADGYTRATGRMSLMIAQNGPGITNLVTAVKTAYWNHTPLLLVTPQAANRTIGQGGFQEVEQMALFRDMVAYQEEVRDPARMAEVLAALSPRPGGTAPPPRSTSPATSGPARSTCPSRPSSTSSVPRAARRPSTRRRGSSPPRSAP
jgi:sulfoacetaldehyde acetyltransferase